MCISGIFSRNTEMASLGISLGLPSPKLLHNHKQHTLSSSLPLSTNTISLPPISRPTRILNPSTIMASAVELEKQGIKIVNKPSESQLSQLGVRSWPKWGCPPSKFPWTYSSKETCYLLEGKVKVYPDGSDEAVEIGAGDLVVFPKGMSCTWDVSEAVDKHYKFE